MLPQHTSISPYCAGRRSLARPRRSQPMVVRSLTSKQSEDCPMPLEGFDDADIPPRDMGRRSGPGSGAVIDLGIVERSAAIGCSKDEIASVLGIARSAFYRHL